MLFAKRVCLLMPVGRVGVTAKEPSLVYCLKSVVHWQGDWGFLSLTRFEKANYSQSRGELKK